MMSLTGGAAHAEAELPVPNRLLCEIGAADERGPTVSNQGLRMEGTRRGRTTTKYDGSARAPQ